MKSLVGVERNNGSPASAKLGSLSDETPEEFSTVVFSQVQIHSGSPGNTSASFHLAGDALTGCLANGSSRGDKGELIVLEE